MLWHFDLSPREEALAAPSTDGQTRVLSVVIFVCSVLSVLGAGWIILSFATFQQLRSFRHQLILGLAVSDFLMAINFLSSSAMNLHGKNIGDPQQMSFCRYNGFMTQMFVVQTDYWVLSIAVCTHFILADYTSISNWVQDHIRIVSALPWAFSFLWAVVGLVTAGYGDIGAWCWFTSDEVRLLANFIPRWLIIGIMLVMYARLYAVLSHVHRFQSTSGEDSPFRSTGNRLGADTSNGNANAYGRGSRSPTATRRLKRLARLMIMYPAAYMLIWTLPTVIRIYQAATDKAAPFPLQTVDKICVVIQGIIDALIYGINESSLSAWQSLIFPRPQASLERRRSVYRLASRARSKRLRHLVRASDASLDGSLEASSAAHIRRSQYDSEAADRSSEGLVGNSHGISIHRTVEVHVTYGNCQPYARGSS